MGEKTIWISYDLGIRGDYERLYAWLDKYGAKKCGDSLAVIQVKMNDVPTALSRELKRQVTLSRTDRVYIIYRDGLTGAVKGKFIFGGRKRAPWQGYGQVAGETGED